MNYVNLRIVNRFYFLYLINQNIYIIPLIKKWLLTCLLPIDNKYSAGESNLRFPTGSLCGEHQCLNSDSVKGTKNEDINCNILKNCQ